jgi:hypothetical protein
MTENAEVHRASFHARRYESNDDEPQGAANAAQALDPGAALEVAKRLAVEQVKKDGHGVPNRPTSPEL